MKKLDRVKAITALSLADLLFKHDGETNFNANQEAYNALVQQTRMIIFKQFKKDAQISSVSYEHSCRIAEAINDEKIEYMPSFCALNVLFDAMEYIDKLPKGMRIDFKIVEKLAECLVVSSEATKELIKSSGKIDFKIENLIEEIK